MKTIRAAVSPAGTPGIAMKITLAVGVVAAIVVGGIYLRPFIAQSGALVRDQGATGAIGYVLIMAAVVVVVPLSSLPLLPVVAAAWGVLLGGALSVVGWWLGSLVAFLIARRFGRPLLSKIIRLSRLDEFEKKLPGHATFVSIILIRLVFPVEIPSYVLGLTKTVRFQSYALASLIGMTPFAFVMVAMGGAMAAGQWLVFTTIGVVALAIAYGLYLVWQRHTRTMEKVASPRRKTGDRPRSRSAGVPNISE